MSREMSREMNINYNIDDFGVLRVYDGRAILFEVSGFENTPTEKVADFVEEVLAERGAK